MLGLGRKLGLRLSPNTEVIAPPPSLCLPQATTRPLTSLSSQATNSLANAFAALVSTTAAASGMNVQLGEVTAAQPVPQVCACTHARGSNIAH